MSAYLLDTNVLIAILWPGHAQHAKALHWFSKHRNHGWATCPITAAGFVRIISNPAYSPDALPIADALKLLKANTDAGDHRFWTAKLNLSDALSRFGKHLSGHQQITDAYLLALAIERGGVLATLDVGTRNLCKDNTRFQASLHIIA